ncbi:uncharacterized protein BP5553_02438 [Venustampulla echinocandica]|uniref:non-specific serine/threonine protein kinase n=1 Tax=Venustampulla echinocandica TaxID=2656787 RepID=A0A370U3W2_9HELO|nr:uncharacterized protein BP5553_02438 [Venustampulla echinocandica]RDL42459.1 hypothetical protein BP5553_02438 [Venustampulla echinocandica]
MPSLWIATTTLWKSFSAESLGESASNAAEVPRLLPASGFKTIEANQQVEEGELPDYRVDRFYPVRLGEVFQDRYQVIAKLGFGSSSTIWLARDLKQVDHQYVALKVYVHTSLVHRELPCYQHMARHMADSLHQGRGNIRRFIESFEVTGPDGKHIILVFEAAQMSLRDMKVVFRPNGFDEDRLHVHHGNMLLGIYDSNLLRKLEKMEFTSPVPRKPVSSTRTIYLSRLMLPKGGPMLLSDFGEARIGPGPHGGDIMPLEYRAPETLLYVGWSYPVDIWSVGLTAWDLLNPKRLFTARDDDGDLYDAAHLAQLIAALGPPPPEFLAKNPERRADFWDEQGEWLGLAPIPDHRTMEALETQLEDKSGFLQFMRRALTWLPEKRATAKELLQDPWLTGEKAY